MQTISQIYPQTSTTKGSDTPKVNNEYLRSAKNFESNDLLEISGVLENNQLVHISSIVLGTCLVYFKMANDSLYVVKLVNSGNVQYSLETVIIQQILSGAINNTNLDHEKRRADRELAKNYFHSLIIENGKTRFENNLQILEQLSPQDALGLVYELYFHWVTEVKMTAFMMFEEERETYNKLFAYMIRQKELCAIYGLNLKKGLAILGPVGVGKTGYFYFRNWFALHVVLAVEEGNVVVNLKKAIDASSQVSVIFVRSCQDITESFLKAKDEDEAHLTLKNIKTNVSSEYIFDDLGVENTNLSRYGNVYNLMADVLTSRYELYERHQTKTDLTSNLITEQIGNIYGARITDRLRSMCNLVFFPQNSTSKRV